MRAKEFLFEDYTQRLDSDLNNLLVGAKGNGATTIETSALANELQRMGYSINVNNIVGLLQNNPNITNVTPEEITLTGGENINDMGQDSAEKVKDMARNASKLG